MQWQGEWVKIVCVVPLRLSEKKPVYAITSELTHLLEGRKKACQFTRHKSELNFSFPLIFIHLQLVLLCDGSNDMLMYVLMCVMAVSFQKRLGWRLIEWIFYITRIFKHKKAYETIGLWIWAHMYANQFFITYVMP